MHSSERIEIGILGGVGQRLDLQNEITMDVPTPYGQTSTAIRVGEVGGKRVAYLVRRGERYDLQPHLVPGRANIWALASLGVRTLITTTAAGGLREPFGPGTFVVLDQLIDRTAGRASTFFDTGPSVQLSAAEPFDPMLRNLASESLAAQKVRFRDFGTAVVVNGPRFSTHAESRFHSLIGGDIVVMTLMPETTLALELGMAVVSIAFVTDSDTGIGHTEIVTEDLVRRRVTQGRRAQVQTVTDIVRAVPAAFQPTTTIPQEAIAAVLNREPVLSPTAV